jgi:allophanate hydrolase subunit 2
MKKKYNVSVDITFNANVEVEADSEEMAMRLAEQKVYNEPMYYVRNGYPIGQIAVCADEEDV